MFLRKVDYYNSRMELRVYPDPILTQVSEPVTEFDKPPYDGGLLTLCADMIQTMRDHNGAGLSAVQVGVLQRIVVMEIPGNDPHIFINPEIRDSVIKRFKYSEGCLSVPSFFDDRERSESVLLHWDTPTGEHKFHWFSGIEAFCIQHEMDHLDGKLFIDDLSPLKKDRIRKKIEKKMRRK